MTMTVAMVRVAKLLECIIAEARRETKGVRASPAIVGYRHPEVALIEIMIGRLMWSRQE